MPARSYYYCLLLVFLLNCLRGQAQEKDYSFVYIDIGQGLSGNQVNTVYKDSRGFLWIGTLTGLNRYDGYSFKLFRHDDSDSASLNDDDIIRVFEGPSNKLWIQSRSGFCIYDQLTEKISRNTQQYFQSVGLPSDGFRTILRAGDNYYFVYANAGVYEYRPGGKIRQVKQSVLPDHATNPITSAVLDSKGYGWLLRYNGALEKVDLELDRQLLRTGVLQKENLQLQFGYEMFIDSQDDIWLYQRSTLAGLFRYDAVRNLVTHYQTNSTPAAISSNSINGIAEDSHGQIWIATDHGGLNIFNKKSNTMEVLLNDPSQKNSIADEAINSVYKDDQGIMWLGTNKKGIHYYDERTNQFPLYHRAGLGSRRIPFDDINAFAEDKAGNWWIGTNGGGLVYYDRIKGTCKTFRHNKTDPNSLTNDVVVALHLDRQEKLWIGTYLGGMDCFDGQRFTHFKHDPSQPTSIADDRVFSIYEDRTGNLWVGTNNFGLDRFDRAKKIFYHYQPADPQAVHSPNISSLAEDARGNLWVGTAWGIDLLDKNTGRFIHYLKENSRLSYNGINGIMEDHAGNVWVATNRGLNVLLKGHTMFKSFFVKDGLADNTVLEILEDDQHYIWVSSKSGISKIEVLHQEGGDISVRCINYNEFDGLQGREFNRYAAMKTRNGELVFGGANGFNVFDPGAVRNTHSCPPLVLTRFSLFNKEIRPGEAFRNRVILDSSISHLGSLTLKHFENDFSFSFAALEFTQANKTRYAYKLEGFNKDWIVTDGSSRQATYTNIDPGNYRFLVKASNADGSWNEDGMIRLCITVMYPWWKTELAWLAYIVIGLSLLFVARKMIIRREKRQYAIVTEREESRRMHELDLMKIRFFTNVSHEFKTPLSLIITPLEKMIGQVKDPSLADQLQLMQRNAKRLLNMVNQLLDFRKMEVNELRLHSSRADIVAFLRDLSYAFTDLAEKKHIRFRFDSAIERLDMDFDQDKMERILFNLLSNAFKFTPENGTVNVALFCRDQKEGSFLEIEVKDTGIGIEKEKQGRIFERFFQAALPGNMLNQGSGIGLAITREFVEMHQGKIFLESQPGQGSRFRVLLPLQLLPEEKTISLPEAGREAKKIRRKPVILLVEDNEDFRFYLKDNLREIFTVLEAADGREGWKKALAEHPDLVVSDISMPGMDGLELCRKIKTDDRTRHMPVILLTALADEKQQLLALETGPNDYLTKPFNFEILLSRMKNLIQFQEQVKQTYQKQVAASPAAIDSEITEDDFVRRVLAIVEANMGNPDFSVDQLRQELLLSRTSMYKKMLGLTGKTPIEFIRSIRLQRAAQLLEKTSYNVTEIAYMVGFNNPKYFARYFREEFGVLPSLFQSATRKLPPDQPD
ncbi:MAG: two-component regulator propeller domain-containing protein [Flavihumibacter sp.]